MQVNTIRDEIDKIKNISKKTGNFSWTSDRYQNDLIDNYIQSSHFAQGANIIEVGTYKGGLSAILAYLTAQAKGILYTIEIEKTYLNMAESFITKLGYDNVEYFHGSLQAFARSIRLESSPALIVIDGDHSYDGVIEDIKGLYLLNKRPYAAIFHDYGLRNDTFPNDKVDEAINVCFDNSISIQPIGDQIGKGSTLPTIDRKADDGHYWVDSEDAIIILPDGFQLNIPEEKKLSF